LVLYDINSLPVSAHKTSESAITHRYDQAGWRVKKVDGATATQYLYSADGQPFAATIWRITQSRPTSCRDSIWSVEALEKERGVLISQNPFLCQEHGIRSTHKELEGVRTGNLTIDGWEAPAGAPFNEP
jgi:hypothetical protein